MDSVWPSLRGNFWTRATRRASAGSAIRLSPQRLVDLDWRGARRRGAGLRDFIRVLEAQWQITRPNGEGRIEFHRWFHRHVRDSRHHGDPARRIGSRRGESAGGTSVGHLYRRRNGADRDVNGRLLAVLACGQSLGSLRVRRGVPAAGGLGRETGLCGRALGQVADLRRGTARVGHHCLRLAGECAAGVAAARTA